MKVGTDGCLLGAWAEIKNSKKLLDIGCGSGLIAIMAAQRCKAQITAIEIDKEAAAQAKENAISSPWGERIKIINDDFLKYKPETTFDTILCNPPYFINSLKCPDTTRNTARHDDALPYTELLQHAYEILCNEGRISIIIPTDIQKNWEQKAENTGFKITRITYMRTLPQNPPKRVLMEFAKNSTAKTDITHFTLETTPGVFSEESKSLLSDFYLKL